MSSSEHSLTSNRNGTGWLTEGKKLSSGSGGFGWQRLVWAVKTWIFHPPEIKRGSRLRFYGFGYLSGSCIWNSEPVISCRNLGCSHGENNKRKRKNWVSLSWGSHFKYNIFISYLPFGIILFPQTINFVFHDDHTLKCNSLQNTNSEKEL